jgi:hypothetical protein
MSLQDLKESFQDAVENIKEEVEGAPSVNIEVT